MSGSDQGRGAVGSQPAGDEPSNLAQRNEIVEARQTQTKLQLVAYRLQGGAGR